MEPSGWVGARRTSRFEIGGIPTFEERVTIWRAADRTAAIRLATA